MQDFYSLFVNELKSMYSAEEQMIKALPEMAKAASSDKLKEAFHRHLAETKNQLRRLDAIGSTLKEKLAGGGCDVMKSLIKEGQKIIKSKYDRLTRDAALIDCAQRIEHFEICSYGILKSYARHFKLDAIEDLLEASSREEGNADKKLTDIAEGTIFDTGVNVKACKRCA